MYSPDTLQRLNDAAVEKYQAEVAREVAKRQHKLEQLDLRGAPRSRIEKARQEGDTRCDYCDNPADLILPIYNPADAVRNPPLDGAYGTASICNDCHEAGREAEDGNFYCPYCGELFVVNHSWDVVATWVDDEGYVCQKCYVENCLQTIPLGHVLDDLATLNTKSWLRLKSIPGGVQIWEGEFSEWEDFPGWQPRTFPQMCAEIRKAAKDHGLDDASHVVPLITHGYQFSVVLEIWATKGNSDARDS